jgi:hypothetical protein
MTDLKIIIAFGIFIFTVAVGLAIYEWATEEELPKYRKDDD